MFVCLPISHSVLNSWYRCPLCDIQSGRKDNILRHIRNLHSTENFDEIVKKISKTVPRLKVPNATEQPVADVYKTTELNANQTSNVQCQYQSVIQFAGRSKTTPPPPPPRPIHVGSEGAKEMETKTSMNVSDASRADAIEKTRDESFSKELRVELTDVNDGDQKISNISIYRQLLSPYLRPPPNLDCRNGSQEQETHRGYQAQRDRLPIRKENVDIYRSILMCATDQDPQTVIQNSDTGIVHWSKRTSQCFNQIDQ